MSDTPKEKLAHLKALAERNPFEIFDPRLAESLTTILAGGTQPYAGMPTLLDAPHRESLEGLDIALIGGPFDLGGTHRRENIQRGRASPRHQFLKRVPDGLHDRRAHGDKNVGHANRGKPFGVIEGEDQGWDNTRTPDLSQRPCSAKAHFRILVAQSHEQRVLGPAGPGEAKIFCRLGSMPPPSAFETLEVKADVAELLERPREALKVSPLPVENGTEQNVLDHALVSRANAIAQGLSYMSPLPAQISIDSPGENPPSPSPNPRPAVRMSFAPYDQQGEYPDDHADKRGDDEERLIQLRTGGRGSIDSVNPEIGKPPRSIKRDCGRVS